MNFSKYHDHPFVFSGNKVKILHEGDRIEIFRGQKLEVLETPGHDPGCLTYFTENYIFTGDSYLFDTKVITSFPKSDKEQAKLSLEKIISYCDKNRTVCPGHGVIKQVKSDYKNLI